MYMNICIYMYVCVCVKAFFLWNFPHSNELGGNIIFCKTPQHTAPHCRNGVVQTVSCAEAQYT